MEAHLQSPNQRRRKGINIGRANGEGMINRGWVREGDVPPPARSAEAFKNVDLAVHKLYMQHMYKNKTQ